MSAHLTHSCRQCLSNLEANLNDSLLAIRRMPYNNRKKALGLQRTYSPASFVCGRKKLQHQSVHLKSAVSARKQ